MAKFNKGDKVRIKVVNGHSADDHLVGQQGEIIEDDSCYTYRYKLRLDSGDKIDNNAFSDDELELVEEAEETMNFKVGDEVTVIGNDCDTNKSHIGEQGKVIAIFNRHSYYPFEVLLDSGEPIEFSAKELELTKKPLEAMTYKEALKLAIDGTKVCVVDAYCAESYVFFDNQEFKWYSGVTNSADKLSGMQDRLWKVWVKPEPPKPLPKFQPKQFVVNSVGDIGIIAGNIGHRGNIPLYDVRFNGTTAKTTPVLESGLSEVVL